MGSIGRYVFRTTMGAFVIILVSLTVVIWFTQAMRDFDLITTQRQTLLVFVGITGLIHSVARHDTRADRAIDGSCARPQQAQVGLRDHRDECGRRVAVAIVEAIPRRCLRGLAPGLRHRRLCLAAQPA